MKVILKKDVAKLGKKGHQVEVANGYALNKLIPNGSAVVATKSKLKELETQNKHRQLDDTLSENNLRHVITALKEQPLVIKMSANEQGHLFQAVSTESILNSAIERELFLNKEMVVLSDEPIKSVGEHKVRLMSGGVDEEVVIMVETVNK